MPLSSLKSRKWLCCNEIQLHFISVKSATMELKKADKTPTAQIHAHNQVAHLSLNNRCIFNHIRKDYLLHSLTPPHQGNWEELVGAGFGRLAHAVTALTGPKVLLFLATSGHLASALTNGISRPKASAVLGNFRPIGKRSDGINRHIF